MGNKYRQPPPDLITSQLSIADRVSTLETTPRSTSTSVDTGHWKFKASNGVTMVDFGDQGAGLGSGWLFRRGNTGKPAFGLGENQSSGDQYWVLYDNSLNTIVSDDASSGQGLSRPYLHVPFMPYNATVLNSQTTTTSTTFTSLYSIVGYKQHPKVDIQYIINTPAGVSAEVALVDTSVPGGDIVLGPNSHPGGSFFFTSLKGTIAGKHLNQLDFDLQARVSGGAGTIGVSLAYVYGIQS